ncbi:MAG: thioredoxin domain-containing protein [Deltaproteobacteria bacterium]|nr:thioredoxin domain-containing protein [Deltaproteobacteria bacterium]
MSTKTEKNHKLARYILLAALLGLGLAAWLTYIHVRVHIDPAYESVCALGEKVNCETIAASAYSVFFGLPVSVWGFVAYAVLMVLAVVEHRRRDGEYGAAGLLTVLSVLMAASSLVLAYISFAIIKALCLYCTATYIVNLAVAVMGIVHVRHSGGFVSCLIEDLAELKKSPWPAIYSVVILTIIVVAGPLRGLPRYWELASWRDGPLLPSGFTDDGYPWLGAETPELVVHEFYDYECPHCRVSHRKLRKILSAHAEEMRIVRHDFARMSCAPNDAKQRFVRCAMARAAYCAGKDGKFWSWNDAVYASPKPLVGEGRKTYELDMGEQLGFDRKDFDTCMFAKETIDYTQRTYKDSRKKRIKETPAYYIDGKRLTFNEMVDIASERL